MLPLALVPLLGGCSGTVSLDDAPALSGADARTCAALVKALPDRVSDQPRRKADTGDGYAAAWGDPAIELRCGVPKPAGLTPASACQTTNGVDWFVPPSQVTGRPTDVTMTTVGRVGVRRGARPRGLLPAGHGDGRPRARREVDDPLGAALPVTAARGQRSPVSRCRASWISRSTSSG